MEAKWEVTNGKEGACTIPFKSGIDGRYWLATKYYWEKKCIDVVAIKSRDEE